MKGAAAYPLVVASTHQRFADFVTLTKPRLNLLVVVTAAVGYYLGAVTQLHLAELAGSVIGIALVAGGAAGLNQVYERDTDSLMWRTRTRPLAAQRLTPSEATIFSLVLAVAGLALVAVFSNLLATLLALTTLLSYNVVYTPMKRWSQMATLVGAVPGALPPMIGWVAGRGTLDAEAWALFAIVFIWQIPHFMAIAWMYRDDFGRAGFPMAPVVSPNGLSTAWWAILFSLALVPASVAPYVLHMSGATYLAGAVAGSVVMLALSVWFALKRTDDRARLLFFASITYLPLLWILLLADRTGV